MLKPKITILIPTFEREPFLARAIESVTSQSFTDLVVRIHDNGSDDATQKLMSSLMSDDSRIEYYRHNNNIGALLNFQSLIDTLETPFYSILSDDDFFLPGHLEAGLKMLNTYPEAYLYSSATATVNLLSNKISLRNQSYEEGFYKPSKELTSKISREHFTSTGTIFSIKVKDQFAGFHPIGMDDVFSVLLTGSFPFVLSPKIGAVFTINKARDYWFNVADWPIETFIMSGAIDRKFVIDHAPIEMQTVLLKYLEVIYGTLLEKKAMHYSKNQTDNNNINFDDLNLNNTLFEYLSRSSFNRALKSRLPDFLLFPLLYASSEIGKFRKKSSSNKISNLFSRDGIEYLKCFDLLNKNKFLDEFHQAFIRKKLGKL